MTSWSRSPSRSGRKGFQPSLVHNDWLVVSSLKTSVAPNLGQTGTGRPRSASVRPRLAWTKRPESALSVRSYDLKQSARSSEGQRVPDIAEQTDEIVVTFDPEQPECPVIHRQLAAREANPDRINLDCRNFTACPVLKNEARLRLLNLENNTIKEISNLNCLPNLIFLDLYNNQIKKLSGLECLPSLRVLMLGKNFIKQVENLSCLQKLDVLDLHSNLIESVSGIETLKELRVLNLAGNSIVNIDHLSKLSALSELNLRRNSISQVGDSLLCLTTLTRLFLSHNKISSMASFSSLSDLQTLAELSLDGNPIADESSYRASLLDQFSNLKVLDGKRISSEERRLCKVMTLFPMNPEGRLSTRELSKGFRSSRFSSGSPVSGDRLELVDAVRSSWRQRLYSRSNSKTLPSFYDFLTKKGHLSVYGPCLEVLISARCINLVSISFHYIDFNGCSSYFVSIRDSVPLLRKLSFRENDLHTFYQLDTLSVLQDLNEIEIADNPIIRNLPMFRAYLIFRIPAIQIINSALVDVQDRESAFARFDPLKTLWRTSSIQRIKGFCQPQMVMPHLQYVSDSSSLCERIIRFQMERPSLSQSITTLVCQTIKSINSYKIISRNWSEMMIELFEATVR